MRKLILDKRSISIAISSRTDFSAGSQIREIYWGMKAGFSVNIADIVYLDVSKIIKEKNKD